MEEEQKVNEDGEDEEKDEGRYWWLAGCREGNSCPLPNQRRHH